MGAGTQAAEVALGQRDKPQARTHHTAVTRALSQTSQRNEPWMTLGRSSPNKSFCGSECSVVTCRNQVGPNPFPGPREINRRRPTWGQWWQQSTFYCQSDSSAQGSTELSMELSPVLISRHRPVAQSPPTHSQWSQRNAASFRCSSGQHRPSWAHTTQRGWRL